MFRGDLLFEGSPLILNIIGAFTFLTIVVLWTGDSDDRLLFIEAAHSILCYSSFKECFLTVLILWSFRNIERMMGSRPLLNLFIYNLLTYLPFFVLMVVFLGFLRNIILIRFIPYSLFIYMLWNLPSISVSGFLGDKIVVILFFVALMIPTFPFCFVPLFTSIFGNILFHKDVFCLKKLIKVREDTSTTMRVNHETTNNRISMSDVRINEDDVLRLVDMGVPEERARQELIRSRGNINRAAHRIFRLDP